MKDARRSTLRGFLKNEGNSEIKPLQGVDEGVEDGESSRFFFLRDQVGVEYTRS